MAKRKVVSVTFIDDGDDLTDSAVLAGLALATAKKNPAIQEKVSPPAVLKKSDFKKKE